VNAVYFALLGLGLAAIFSLVGQGVILVYRASGVLNFGSVATGIVGAYVYNDLWTGSAHLPWPLAMAAGIIVSAAIGALVYLLVMRRLRTSAPISQIVATLGVMTTLIAVATLIFAPTGATIAVASVLPTWLVRPFGPGAPVGVNILILAAIAVALTIGLIALQKFTRFGLALTAVHENPVVAAAAGWSPDRVAVLAWTLGSALSGAAVILVVPLSGLTVDSAITLLIPALAAALVGRFESFSLALLGAVIIGVGESLVSLYVGGAGWTEAAPLIVVIVVLLLRGSSLPGRSTTLVRLVRVGPGKLRAAGLAAIAAGIVLTAVVSVTWLGSITTTFLLALVVVSVVVVTGYAGQISLAQLAFAGLGAYFTALFAIVVGMPTWLAIVASVLVTIPIGAVVAVGAVRVRGANLAVVTLAVGTVVSDLVLTSQWAAANLENAALPPLRIFGVTFSEFGNPRSYGLLALGALLLGTLVAANLRRGASGRRLLAVRANERAASALGISVPANKLYAFAVATGIAAFAGALMETQFAFADFSLFQVQGSVNATLEGVLGGLGWVSGAIIGASTGSGAVGAQVLSVVTSATTWLELIAGISVIVIILQSANGLIDFNLAAAAKMAAALRQRVPGRGAAARPAPPRWAAPALSVVRSVRAREAGTADTARTVTARPPCTIRLEDVSVRIGATIVLDHVSLEVRPGEVVGLIGPNGAGKSTLIDAVGGFQRLAGGSITVDGRPITRLSSARRARLGISRSFQALELFEDMTVLENLQVASDRVSAGRYLADLVWPRRSALSEATQLAVREFRLEPILGKFPADVDYATRRLVAIARAMAGAPAVILLDEPAAGLDSAERAELASLIRRIADGAGVGVMLVEHDVDLVFGLCDRIVALDRGRVIAAGSPADVRADERLKAVYLGDPAALEEAAAPRAGAAAPATDPN
jgi:ABC-type branched-subunit amino acid transport system ATPase component/ABC-type branched-subunit amino acid transport system permease subunit